MISTPRILLRDWREDDLEPLIEMCADPEVMRYFPAVMTRDETIAMLGRINEHFVKYKYGMYAAELKFSGDFLGFIGLSVPRFEAHFTPCVEIGWRLRKEFWNQGLATEGARAVLDFAFSNLKLKEVVAMTAVQNIPSRRVMEKLGMDYDPKDDFDHPLVPEGNQVRRSVLYRIKTRDKIQPIVATEQA